MSIEKNLDGYIGDIVGGMVREAALLKMRAEAAERRVAELESAMAAVKPPAEAGGGAEMLTSR
jgi:hypothetical protein